MWQHLSLAFEEKVSKHNFKSVLRQRARKGNYSSHNLVFPDGQVPLNSDLYIERPPSEAKACAEVFNPGALIVIKSPLNMGKTSLMTRILAHGRSQKCQTVSLNLQLAEVSILSDLNKFLRWLMANITLQLGIKSEINQYWDRDLGSKISCTNYLQQHILKQLDSPLILALDEVNHLFDYPQIAQEFLPLIRFWHEEASYINIWQRLRIIVVHSTDAYIPLDIDQSPFNLGLPVILPEFNLEQVQELAFRHQFCLEVDNLEQNLRSLMEMVGGYPYLVRLAFYVLSTQPITFQQLLTEAPTPSGIYRHHLQEYCLRIAKYPELVNAFRQVVATDSPTQISSIAAYKLESMGLTKLSGNKVIPSCQLYRLYFRDYLNCS